MKKIICKCGKKIRISREMLGKRGKCPRCKRKITLSRTLWEKEPDVANVGEYDVIRELSRGSGGILYEVRHQQTANKYVAKITFSSKLDEHTLRLQRERAILKRLQHSNIVKMVDDGEMDGRNYLVTDFIEGKTLEDYLEQQNHPCPTHVTLAFMIKMAEILDYVHEQQIIHRHLKAANIILTPDFEPILFNFAIATATDDDPLEDDLQNSAVISTTIDKQNREDITDQRYDIYALGCILYELLTAQAIVPSVNMVLDAAPPPSFLNSAIPDELDIICGKAMARSPEDRYQSMREFIGTLTAYVGVRNPDYSNGLRGHFQPYEAIMIDSTDDPVDDTGSMLMDLDDFSEEMIVEDGFSTGTLFSAINMDNILESKRNKVIIAMVGLLLILLVTGNILYIASIGERNQLRRDKQELQQQLSSTQVQLATNFLALAQIAKVMGQWQKCGVFAGACLESINDVKDEQIAKMRDQAKKLIYLAAKKYRPDISPDKIDLETTPKKTTENLFQMQVGQMTENRK